MLCVLALSLSHSLSSQPILSWNQAQKGIITKAKLIASYDPEICMWSVKNAELILSKDYESQSWGVAYTIIDQLLPQLPVYHKALTHPNDTIWWQELTLQASMISAQCAAQVNDSFELGSKVIAIIGCYIDVLRETLRK